MVLTRQYPLLAPIGSLSSNGLRMRVLVYSTGIAWNELIRGYASVVLTSSSFHPSTHTHTRTHTCTHTHTHSLSLSLIPFEDRKPTGIQVDIAAYY